MSKAKSIISYGVFFYSLSLLMFFFYIRSIKITSYYYEYAYSPSTVLSFASFNGILGFLTILFLIVATVNTIIGINRIGSDNKKATSETKPIESEEINQD